MKEGNVGPGHPTKNQAPWRAIGDLLYAGQYGRAAQRLHQMQAANQRAGDATPMHTLDAARRICMACRQCREEAAWHQRASQEADRRERALRQQLDHLLDLVSGREMLATLENPEVQPSTYAAWARPSERGLPELADRPALRRHLQRSLWQRPLPRSPQKEILVVPAHTSTFRSVTPVDHLDALKYEEATRSPAAQEMQLAPFLAVYCLGPFRVYQDDRLIAEWDSLKGRAILKYLIAHRETPIVRDILMDLFWPNADPEAARRNLHQAIYSLRQTLRRGRADFQHVQFQEECYLLNPEMEIWVDWEEFQGHVQAARRLETAGQRAKAMAVYGIAESLYQGDFLEEDLYEDWPRVQREHMRAMYCDLVDRLSAHYLQQGAHNAAIALCQKLLTQDNCNEDAHRRLMACYLAQGQRHLAVRQYQCCIQALQEELDLAPAKETTALYRRIVANK